MWYRAFQKYKYVVGFEVLTAVTINSFIFWDIISSSSVKGSRRFGGTYRLLLQGRRVSQTRSYVGTGRKQISAEIISSGLEQRRKTQNVFSTLVTSAVHCMSRVEVSELRSSISIGKLMGPNDDHQSISMKHTTRMDELTN
jgi:hypothetical protein